MKNFLQIKFQTKNLRQLKYFLRIEAAQSLYDISLSQKIYMLDSLSETGIL